MKYLLLLVCITIAFQGCYMATKTKELGGGISNINHPIALGIGAILYKTGEVLEDKAELEE